MADQLSDLYADILEGSYDCVDRIVLNAYFGMGQTPGGFRVWWRELYRTSISVDCWSVYNTSVQNSWCARHSPCDRFAGVYESDWSPLGSVSGIPYLRAPNQYGHAVSSARRMVGRSRRRYGYFAAAVSFTSTPSPGLSPMFT
jgi:hypothetical protein